MRVSISRGMVPVHRGVTTQFTGKLEDLKAAGQAAREQAAQEEARLAQLAAEQARLAEARLHQKQALAAKAILAESGPVLSHTINGQTVTFSYKELLDELANGFEEWVPPYQVQTEYDNPYSTETHGGHPRGHVSGSDFSTHFDISDHEKVGLAIRKLEQLKLIKPSTAYGENTPWNQVYWYPTPLFKLIRTELSKTT
jgi:type II secretory pathway pseudopilin PulG